MWPRRDIQQGYHASAGLGCHIVAVFRLILALNLATAEALAPNDFKSLYLKK
jgi:hypothetical protein